MILKVKVRADAEKFDWLIIGNIAEIRLTYENFHKTKKEPTEVKYLLNDDEVYKSIDASLGAYLMNDDGKTIECIEVVKVIK